MRDYDKFSRGFGFVLFEDSSSVDKVISAKKNGSDFVLNEHNIQIKRALPKVPGGKAVAPRNDSLFRKIFVGGLPSSITEQELQNYFEQYGRVNEIELLRDRETSRLRGFAFVTFEDEDSADKCLQRRSHEICKKICEVKRAHTRQRGDRDDGQNRRSSGGYDNRDSRQPTSNQPPGGGGASAARGMGMEEVNQLIQQAFLMGQQSLHPGIQAPTAASLLNGAGAAPTAQPDNILLQALMNQQSIPAPPPAVPAPAPAPAAPASSAALVQLAQLLQSGGINANALGALLKGDVQPAEDKTSTGYQTSYPPVSSYDHNYKSSNYGSNKDDGKRRYNPY